MGASTLAPVSMTGVAASPWTGRRWWLAVAVVAALGLVPYVLWRVLKLWPGGQLAAKTNASTA